MLTAGHSRVFMGQPRLVCGAGGGCGLPRPFGDLLGDFARARALASSKAPRVVTGREGGARAHRDEPLVSLAYPRRERRVVARPLRQGLDGAVLELLAPANQERVAPRFDGSDGALFDAPAIGDGLHLEVVGHDASLKSAPSAGDSPRSRGRESPGGPGRSRGYMTWAVMMAGTGGRRGSSGGNASTCLSSFAPPSFASETGRSKCESLVVSPCPGKCFPQARTLFLASRRPRDPRCPELMHRERASRQKLDRR